MYFFIILLWGHKKWKLLCFKTGKVPTNELQIYTWKDASLKELTSLVREVNTESRRKGTFFDFALIYPSPSSRGNFQRQTNQFMDYISKEIGTTVSGRKGVDDSKVSTLVSQINGGVGINKKSDCAPPNRCIRASLNRLFSTLDTSTMWLCNWRLSRYLNNTPRQCIKRYDELR